MCVICTSLCSWTLQKCNKIVRVFICRKIPTLPTGTDLCIKQQTALWKATYAMILYQGSTPWMLKDWQHAAALNCILHILTLKMWQYIPPEYWQHIQLPQRTKKKHDQHYLACYDPNSEHELMVHCVIKPMARCLFSIIVYLYRYLFQNIDQVIRIIIIYFQTYIWDHILQLYKTTDSKI